MPLTHVKFFRKLVFLVSFFEYKFKLVLRTIRLKFPGVILWRIFFAPSVHKQIEMNWMQNISSLNSFHHSSISINENRSILEGKVFLLAIPQTVSRSRLTVESDMHFVYAKSILAFGGKLSKIKNLDEKTEKSSKFDASSQIDFIILDGNETPNHGRYSSEFLSIISQLDSRILVDIPDCYRSKDGRDKIQSWLNYADLIITHNSTVNLTKSARHRILFWPGFPAEESLYYRTWQKKTLPISILGYSHRQRAIYQEMGLRWDIPLSSSLHANNDQSSVVRNYSQYIENIRNHKINFSNGYISRRESIIVGRAIETILSGSVLMYETGSDLENFLEPYKHFVPIKNVPDFIDTARFLIENDYYAEQIATDGYRFYESNFGAQMFWQEVLTVLQ